MDSNIGKKLDGRYEIIELIGVGGMADVYKAVDVMEDREVAVKVLKDEFSQNEEFLRRFRNESKAIAVLSHPNIVKIYDVGFTDEIQFIVMEYIDGLTLKEFIEQQGVLRWKDALHFTTQILRALQHAHDKGIVHRDIKPQNIMLFADGTIKVMDFGIARFSRVDGKTVSDKTIGSVHYISPEQARGDMTDERSDIYSVGVLLYEMLTGKKPFDGDNPVAIALKHMQEDPILPREINPSIPEALEEIVIRAMERDPAKRYQSAAEMIKDFDTFKLNPSVVFGYANESSIDDESTMFFTPVTTDIDDDYDEDYDNYDEDYDYDGQEDDEDEEDEKKRSYVVPILMAVTVAVVVIAAIVCAIVLVGNFGKDKTHTATLQIPDLVGQDIVTVQKKWKDKLTFEITEEYSNDYDEGIIMDQSEKNKTVREGYSLALTVSKGKRLIVVPEMANKTADIARSELMSAGFTVRITEKYDDSVAKGLVISTEPAAGTQYPEGGDVKIVVSKGEVDKNVKVPKVVGLTEEKATAKLNENKLTVKVEKVAHEGDKGKVVSQSINPGEYVERKTEVIIYVSTGEVDPVKLQLKLPLPEGVWGAYEIIVYSDGNKKCSKSIERAETVAGSSISIDIEGTKEETLTVEVINNETGGRVSNYAKYLVNYEKEEISLQGSVNESGLLDITPETTTTTTTTSATTTTTTSATTTEAPATQGTESPNNSRDDDDQVGD